MKADLLDDYSKDNVMRIKENLEYARSVLEKSLTLSLDEIKADPTSEKNLIELWSSYFQGINYFFLQESERTNNKEIYKNVLKHMMFRRW